MVAQTTSMSSWPCCAGSPRRRGSGQSSSDPLSRPLSCRFFCDRNVYYLYTSQITIERSHRLDLDQRLWDRQIRDLHQCARGRVGPEELRAHLAVRLPITHVDDEDGDLDDIVHGLAPRRGWTSSSAHSSGKRASPT